MALTGTRVTCVKGTNVQILTQKALTDELEAEILANCNGQNSVEELGTHVTCLTDTKVQILTQKVLLGESSNRHSIYLLYWYKSTHTDADGGASLPVCECGARG
jgi:hypothetical protein